MELLIFSDSHGRADGMTEAIARQIGRIDGVCFLGDGLRDAEALSLVGMPLYAVRGNCDWSADAGLYRTERTLSFEGHTLLLVHGHLYGVKGGLGALISHAALIGADIVLFGHTHAPHHEILPAGTVIGERALARPMHLFNPGSIGYDENGEGCAFGSLLLRRDTVLFSHGRI